MDRVYKVQFDGTAICFNGSCLGRDGNKAPRPRLSLVELRRPISEGERSMPPHADQLCLGERVEVKLKSDEGGAVVFVAV